MIIIIRTLKKEEEEEEEEKEEERDMSSYEIKQKLDAIQTQQLVRSGQEVSVCLRWRWGEVEYKNW